MTQRTGTIKSMDELMKTTSNLSLQGKVKNAFALINEKKQIEKTGISIEELRIIIGKVIAMCGIKEIPSQEVANMCLQAFNEKFSISMNKHEVALAFDLNIKGEYEIRSKDGIKNKVEHYQCFSVEFFCEVLNEYRKKKIQAKAHEEQKEEEIEVVDVSNQILQAIIDDFIAHHSKEEIKFSFPILIKIETLDKLFDVDVSVENLEKLRPIAAVNVWRQLAKRRNESQLRQKFGAEISFRHQIARIKAEKLITSEDETLIQTETNHLLYYQVFDKWKSEDKKDITKSKFITHIKNQM